MKTTFYKLWWSKPWSVSFWITMVIILLAEAGYLEWSNLACAQYGGDNPPQNQEIQTTISIQTKRYDAANWQSSGTTIASGGLSSSIHKARVQITFDPALGSSETVNISLVGAGAGYQPKSCWWWNNSQIKAQLIIDGVGTYTFGDPSPLVLTSPTTLTGTLISSNAVEATTIRVSIPGQGISSSRNVSFVPGILTATPDATIAVPGYPLSYSVSLTLDGTPVDGHLVNITVKSVTLRDGTVITGSLGTTESNSTDFSSYLVTAGDGRVASITTGSSPVSTSVTATEEVKSFSLELGDMAVAQ